GRVHKVDGLRVIDASIMPNMVSSNLNAPTIMMTERLSDAILEKALLPRSDAKVYIAPNWETKQRGRTFSCLPPLWPAIPGPWCSQNRPAAAATGEDQRPACSGRAAHRSRLLPA